MASTRNNNTLGNYCLQSTAITNQRQHSEFINSPAGAAHNPGIPLIGSLPSTMPASLFSKNPIEIESSLFGIGSTNLVCPSLPVTPYLTPLPTKQFFKMPKVISEPKCLDYGPQRPFPII
tara:strand:+ start:19194 stop:19553 length:360 start_codon:yes stop_codon:yes gene_type:complete